MARMQVAVAVVALFCCCLAQEDGGQEVKPAAFDVVASQGVEAVKIDLPDNAKTEGGNKKRADQYDCYVPSLGTWKRHGDVFRLSGSNCITYRCAYGQYDFLQEACSTNTGQCVPVGSDITYGGCSKLRCVKRERNNYREYGFEAVGTPQCSVNGKCYQFGEIWEHYCQQKRCVSNGRPGGYDIQDVGYGDRCQDSTGRCWNRGEVFSDWLNGRHYNHCVCNGGTAGYQCYNYGNAGK